MTAPIADALSGAREGVAAALLAVGLLLVAASGLGLLRFPDFYTRIHAAKLAWTVGAPFVLAGLALLAFDAFLLVKLALLAGLLFFIAPTAAHVLASAAHGAGLTPVSGPHRPAGRSRSKQAPG